jgi:DNA-binding MarR family transcriptional regulator
LWGSCFSRFGLRGAQKVVAQPGHSPLHDWKFLAESGGFNQRRVEVLFEQTGAAMVALSEEDDQAVGVLGEKLFLESNTLTPILKKLESMGYVRRQRDPADGPNQVC